MKTVQAKFKCNSVEENEYDKRYKFMAVVGNNGENKDFNNATPYGQLEIAIRGDVPAASFFAIGKEYYLDFTESE